MLSLLTYTSPHLPCSYLAGETARFQNEVVSELSAEEYQGKLILGWRRFGHTLFKPECPKCRKCLSLRVPVATSHPDRSQKRARAANEREVRLKIGSPAVSREKLELYDRFHAFQTESKGWPEHGPKDADDYIDSFVENPFATEEWCYYLGERLIGVGYVDRLPAGLSAIYFFYDPDECRRSLGTFNVLSVICNAAESGLPHVYLGYYVEGCRSLEYKGRFRPNQVLGPDGRWVAFRQ